MKKIFIDGSKGTTGLQIFERLSQRRDIELITLPEELRKSPDARKEALNQSDIAFLCLPDAESIEAGKPVFYSDIVREAENAMEADVERTLRVFANL